ncbi:MAG: DNA primase [Deltaproteobacteria bacterium]|nr:DNA primase [Deltaproteobacteria bacterium]
MSELILDIVRRKVESSKVKFVSRSSDKGEEWHSPCPVCGGGNDRFHVWPNQDGGATAQRAGVPGTFWCRKCGVTGDIIDLLKFCDGLEYQAACKELRIEMDESSRKFRPLRQPKRESASWTPKQWNTPSEKWRGQATKMALAAHEQLLANGKILAYLAGRGLPLEAVTRYRLGYLEGEDKTGTCLYRARSAFDLPDKKNADGTKTRSSLWIPRALTIPLWNGDEAHRVRLRRRKEDLREGKDAKYILLEGSGQAPMTLPPVGVSDDLATWVVVEAELDACAVHHACGGKVGVLAALTNLGKPDAGTHRRLARAKLILVALDFDTADAKGKRPGYQGWLWWKENYAVAKRWPVPQGKDPGEAFALGVDLAEWIRQGMPESIGSLGQSVSGLSASGGGAILSAAPAPVSVAAPVVNRWPQAGSDTPLAYAAYPKGFPNSTASLRKYYAGKSDNGDVLVVCPKTEKSTDKPWNWRYRRYCHRCKGHPQCLADFLFSPQMLAPLGVEEAHV